ncbi:hypothetical protein DRH29_02180 [candidate division Kazan bacterium]|uniref:Uncharacterized protein n=1 Tax=candidate division Kazan bacterium TaxID=2202143 RepID=A0A420ZCY0_UNCK3|nr:MAG: hypothetical protein DRH29_02180 [candidate division Kazan bacterium]
MRGGGFALIIVILVVLAGIYYWSGGKNIQTETPLSLLNDMKTSTEIDFSAAQDTEFTWMVEGADSLTITGVGIEADGLTNEQQDLIGDFLEGREFEVDAANMTAGTIAGLTGYNKGTLVCVVESGVTGGEEGLGADPVTYYVKVSCGELEEEPVAEATDEEQIAALFAEKYNKPIDEIEVVMEKRVKVFASGSVAFAGEPGGSTWLAFNGDGGWKLIFDGSGDVLCADIEGYDFPVDMVPECTDAEGTLVTLT